MLKLRKALLCDKLYLIIIIIVSLITLIRIVIPSKSKYTINDKKLIGNVINIKTSNNKIILTVKAKEKVLVQLNDNTNISLGDKILVKGEFIKPDANTTKYLFNYKKYLERKKIYFIVKSNSIEIINKNKNIYYLIKQKLNNNIKSNAYLKTFIMGDKDSVEKDILTSYQENGISHLFAISGMHITLLAKIIEKLLKKKLSEEIVFKTTSIFLIFYLIIVGYSPSILRGILFYILFTSNNIYYFYIKPINLFILTLSFSLLVNPFYIFDSAFLYSYLISFTLISKSSFLESSNYLKSLFKVSLISFLSSIPISIYNYSSINLLSIFYNMFYVPFVSLIIFPTTLVTLIIRNLEPIYNILINILENTSLLLNNITIGKLVFKRINIIFYIVYVLVFIIYLIKDNKKILIVYLSLLLIHYIIPYFDTKPLIRVLDVGQGDSILIHLDHKNILVDTGTSYIEGNLVNNIIYPSLKQLGINKIDTLIITHGDKDHMGEAIYLINKIKIDKVIFNTGKYNYLENELIKVLDNKKIKYYQDIEILNTRNNKIYFLNTKDYKEENNNSNVLYFKINNYKFLFMGDAGIDKEQDIINEYDLSEIDFLKIGHHGSDTSSSQDFIEKINPKNCLISVGKNNRYNHPKEKVLEILNNYCDIYRTDQNGTIDIMINKSKYKIIAHKNMN